MTEQEIDNIQEQYYELGQIVQIEKTSEELMDKACRYFAEDKEEYAEVFKKLAKRYSEGAKSRRTAYDEKYHKK